MVSVFPDIVKDFPKIKNLPEIFLRSFENVAPAHSPTVVLCSFLQSAAHRFDLPFFLLLWSLVISNSVGESI